MPRKSKKVMEEPQLGQYLTELESLKLGKLDAEMRNAAQGLRLIELEMYREKRKFEEYCATKNAESKVLTSLLATLQPQYEGVILSIAKKYGIQDPKNMLFDPDTGLIRDMSPT